MSFDEGQYTEDAVYPCPDCYEGNVSFDHELYIWVCSRCDFEAKNDAVSNTRTP